MPDSRCFSATACGLSVAASLVMPLKKGAQEKGFQCHRVPKELNVSYGNNSQGIRKKYPEHNKHKKESGNLIFYIAAKMYIEKKNPQKSLKSCWDVLTEGRKTRLTRET